ncbi:MAG: aminotransferase class I/II-fold pyridoxal phosphate-dependent enzyme [Proteobacteria bacterium]|nr:aminotransferase class I/II-fold pyridoxal phosphate-dependent enzyme [Pseudomonadota bacterium]MBU4582708.1 aminotransferase class I/II-fold pyridoxal phosphate-dependent enzyme [Pseudomonadota bacterium]
MGLYADRAGRIDSENAFKMGPLIRLLEEQGRDVVRCNIGEPDFPVPAFIKEEVKRQIDLDNTHYCDPQGIPSLRAAIARQLSETRGIRAEAEVFKNLNINYFSCTAAYNQEGVRLGLESPEGPVAIRKMVDTFHMRRDLVVEGLNAIPGIRCLKPKGTFYVFPNVEGVCRNLGIMEAFEALPEKIRRETSPSTLLQMFLLFEHGVATLDRKSFGRIGAAPFHYLRLSIATGTEDLKKGVERIAACAADREGFRRFFAAGEHFF